MDILYIFLGIILALLLIILGIRWLWHRYPRPCPPSLIWLLNTPFSDRYRANVLSRLQLGEGLSVLDAGCGPGLLTIPIARAVGPSGRVVGLDIQTDMLERARAAAEKSGLSNVTFLQAGLGKGRLTADTFDRVSLVTVLGEIPDPLSALKEIRSCLKPGGFLSVTEVWPDPDYQSRQKVTDLARTAGLQVRGYEGNWFIYTLNLERTQNQ